MISEEWHIWDIANEPGRLRLCHKGGTTLIGPQDVSGRIHLAHISELANSPDYIAFYRLFASGGDHWRDDVLKLFPNARVFLHSDYVFLNRFDAALVKLAAET